MRKIFLSIIIALFAVLCFTTAPKVEAQSTYTCGTPGVEFRYDDNSVEIVVAVDAAKMDPDADYYAVVGRSGASGVASLDFELSDEPINGYYIGNYSISLPTKDSPDYTNLENVTLVVSNNKSACGPRGSINTRRLADITSCTAFAVRNESCAKQFQINRTDERYYDATPDADELEQGAINKVGKIQVPPYSLCQQIPIANNGTGESGVAARAKKQEDARNACCKCATGNESAVFDPTLGNCSYEGSDAVAEITSPNLYTAVGCIPTSPENIIRSVVRIGLGIAGGVALLMILAGAFMYTTSQGEPKRTGEARDMITSAVMGLLFIIFSVVILRFIGVSILQIPGFG